MITRLKTWLKKLLGRPPAPSFEETLLREVNETIEAYRRSGIKIGQGCYLHGVNMGFGEPVEIGNHCALTYCTLLGHDAAPALFIPELQPSGNIMTRISKKKLTRIHDRCFVGANATILCGVSVGPDAIVAAGAVVTKDVPPGTVVAGNPARVISTIEDFVAKHRQEIRLHPEYYPGVK